MTKELLQQCLKALLPHGSCYGNGMRPVEDAAIEGLEQALAQQEQPAQEPVAWMVYNKEGTSVMVTDNPTDISDGMRALPLYTAPPTQPALSDDEILNCFYASKSEGMVAYMLAVGRAIEAHCRGGK